MVDPVQTPGFLLVHGGQIIMDIRHQMIAKRPSYESLAESSRQG